ncbi:MAG TPA: cbb3-type cytochrome c oxidase N-terminal domain-containing protein [Flavobacterium sp.]|uniref:cbb3-type cytochrome c oxidase N-terminal domain-containing protein n=1 Tax=Flavobacterium sp. TaxID=239 RepID=UPI002BBF7D55|nr:cbb3-type cytochrome c oxidase N-terminal domain-containing protein [Flavobacterium sp.]HSD14188.1 cbb3-type cytochrome c oxidase N-terminal domain-containing protein [Flavobacterium sp.]
MKKFFPIYVRIPVLFTLFFLAMEFFIDSGDKPAFIKYPIVSILLLLFLFVLIAFEIVVKASNNVLNSLLTEEQRKAKEAEENLPFMESPFYKNLMHKLTRSKKIEEEKELLLHHDYDGIRELDNVLPPWWVYLFYACIAFAFIYMVRFHILGHDDQITEYEKAMAEAKIAVEEYKKTAPDVMDKEKVTLLTDAESIAAGKTIFETNCVACHRPDAGGAIGPNLTDNHWILGGGIKNVFNTIMEGGRDGKGMVAWKATIKPSDIQKVASYVLSLQGSNPKDAKAPEGDVWTEDGAAPAATATPVTESTESAAPDAAAK